MSVFSLTNTRRCDGKSSINNIKKQEKNDNKKWKQSGWCEEEVGVSDWC
jgi:hypothetical protein